MHEVQISAPVQANTPEAVLMHTAIIGRVAEQFAEMGGVLDPRDERIQRTIYGALTGVAVTIIQTTPDKEEAHRVAMALATVLVQLVDRNDDTVRGTAIAINEMNRITKEHRS